jgi:N-acetylmuramoyl-L-alanine amidase
MVKRSVFPLLGLVFGLFLAANPVALAQTKGFIGARAAALADRTQAGPPAIASTAELVDTGETATLTFTTSAPVEASAFVMAEPDRVIVDLPAITFQLDPQTGKPVKAHTRHAAASPPNRLVNSFRFGSFALGRARVVIDLAGPARVVQTEVAKIDGGDGFRLTIQLSKTDRTAFRAAAQAARAEMAAAEPVAKIEPSATAAVVLPRIIIDPGHGGIDSGAMVGGLIEKTVVLDFAKALAAKLTATGHYNVIMTRDDDTFISLGERVKMARDGNAALFVSVHADTLSEADVTGATVYTVSDKASDAQAARVADQENQSDAAAGVEGKEDANGISDILFDLTRRETRAYSHVFAHTLANYWKVAARLNKNPERSAGFKVLTAPDVPSVLLELGYLSNEKDASALNSQDWRDKTTSQVADAIENFFAARGASTPESAGSPALLAKTAAPATTATATATTAALAGELKPTLLPAIAGASH